MKVHHSKTIKNHKGRQVIAGHLRAYRDIPCNTTMWILTTMLTVRGFSQEEGDEIVALCERWWDKIGDHHPMQKQG